MNYLTIAIDFDDTFTADPALWANFIVDAQKKHHTVLCVTSRRNTPENQELLERAFAQFHITLPIWFCNLGSKLKRMVEVGYQVDIWIDDNPVALVQGH